MSSKKIICVLLLISAVSHYLDCAEKSEKTKPDWAFDFKSLATEIDGASTPVPGRKGYTFVTIKPKASFTPEVRVLTINVFEARSKKKQDLIIERGDNIRNLHSVGGGAYIKLPDDEKDKVDYIRGLAICEMNFRNIIADVPIDTKSFGDDFSLGVNPAYSISYRPETVNVRINDKQMTTEALLFTVFSSKFNYSRMEFLDKRKKVIAAVTRPGGSSKADAVCQLKKGKPGRGEKYLRIHTNAYKELCHIEFEMKKIKRARIVKPKNGEEVPFQSSYISIDANIKSTNKKKLAALVPSKGKKGPVFIPVKQYDEYFSTYYESLPVENQRSEFKCVASILGKSHVTAYDIFDDVYLQFEMGRRLDQRVLAFSKVNKKPLNSWFVPSGHRSSRLAAFDVNGASRLGVLKVRMGPGAIIQREPGVHELELIVSGQLGDAGSMPQKLRRVGIIVKVEEDSKAAYEFLKVKNAMGFLSDFYIARRKGSQEAKPTYYDAMKECLQNHPSEKLKKLVVEVLYDAIFMAEAVKDVSVIQRLHFNWSSSDRVALKGVAKSIANPGATALGIDPFEDEDVKELLEIAAIADLEALIKKLDIARVNGKGYVRDIRLEWWIQELKKMRKN